MEEKTPTSVLQNWAESGRGVSAPHQTFTQFLQYVGVGSSTAEEDACRMEHVASEETVQQICNFVNYGSTFERVMRNTDLRYRYEPGRLSFYDGHLLHGKNMPQKAGR